VRTTRCPGRDRQPHRGGLGAVVLGCVAALASSCHGEFRFDERVAFEDAAVVVPASVDAAPADVPVYQPLPPPDGAPDRAPDLPPPDLAPDHSPPDTALPDRAPTPDADDCYVTLCGWGMEEGRLDCEERTCSGSCGAQCAARCRERARCSLTTGERANLECRGATCSFVVGGGTVHCRDGGSCTVRCLGACALQCEDATCRIQCAADGAPRTVSGNVSCP